VNIDFVIAGKKVNIHSEKRVETIELCEEKMYKPNMTDLQMLGNSFCEFGLVSTYQRSSAVFDPKVHPFENSLQTIAAQLYRECKLSQFC